jgi:hypothetical protein
MKVIDFYFTFPPSVGFAQLSVQYPQNFVILMSKIMGSLQGMTLKMFYENFKDTNKPICVEGKPISA